MYTLYISKVEYFWTWSGLCLWVPTSLCSPTPAVLSWQPEQALGVPPLIFPGVVGFAGYSILS